MSHYFINIDNDYLNNKIVNINNLILSSRNNIIHNQISKTNLLFKNISYSIRIKKKKIKFYKYNYKSYMNLPFYNNYNTTKYIIQP